MTSKQTNIIFILKSGGDFKLGDAYLLATHINKYWKGVVPPSITCFTDKVTEKTGLVGITLQPLPIREYKGWWSKMNLFHPALKKLRPFLYIDLDTAILGDLSKIIPPKEIADKFITLEDFYRKGKVGSALMWIPDVLKINEFWDKWFTNSTKFTKQYRGDQNVIEEHCEVDGFWQQLIFSKVTSFKPDRKWLVELPKSEIVCFHGKPRIPEAATKVQWVNDYKNYAI